MGSSTPKLCAAPHDLDALLEQAPASCEAVARLYDWELTYRGQLFSFFAAYVQGSASLDVPFTPHADGNYLLSQALLALGSARGEVRTFVELITEAEVARSRTTDAARRRPARRKHYADCFA
jgi:hypothetical protein